MFTSALDCVHLLYVNPRWKVYRITTLPSLADNETPYAERGWCYFESKVSLGQCNEVVTIHNGVVRKASKTGKTAVPLTPDRFAQELKSKTFTSIVDRDVVTELYRKAFEGIAATKELEANQWGDEEAKELLAAIPELTGLERVRINNRHDGCTARVSEAVEKELRFQMKLAGCELILEQ